MRKEIVQLKEITKLYNKKEILCKINLSIFEGQSIAITGHNGSGKSTLLKIISGLIKPTSGSIQYPERKPLFHYIPEHFPKMNITARQYIIHMGKLDGLKDKELSKKYLPLLSEFFIASMADIPMKHLSKGTLQKVGVIQALLKTPDILLLDEPLSGQDMKSQDVFIDKMNQLRQQGVTLIMSCHENHLINKISDTVYLIENGYFNEVSPVAATTEEMDVIIFESAPGSKIPDNIRNGSWEQKGNFLCITSPKTESSSIALHMLNNNWKIRGMYHENDERIIKLS